MSAIQPQAPIHSWPVFLAASGVVLTLFLVVLRPEQTIALTTAERAVFWSLHVLIPLGLLHCSQSLVSRFWVFPALGNWPQIAVGGVLGAISFTPLALGMDALFGIVEDDPLGIGLVLDELLGVGPPLILVWLALNATRVLRLPPFESEDAPIEETVPEFWNRVPAAIGRDVIALSAELHYTRVTTTRGDALILYPFGRAVEDLRYAPGVRVHRSHWVALIHVTDVERRGQGAQVFLTGGMSVPVSRSYRKALEQAVS